MWRGALSAPQSLYVHAERPLLSGNATSTLLHEIVHIGLGLADERGADWIVEGLAEYYSLEVLRRSGTISEESAISGFPAVTIRNAMERPEALDTGSMVLTGVDADWFQVILGAMLLSAVLVNDWVRKRTMEVR